MRDWLVKLKDWFTHESIKRDIITNSEHLRELYDKIEKVEDGIDANRY